MIVIYLVECFFPSIFYIGLSRAEVSLAIHIEVYRNTKINLYHLIGFFNDVWCVCIAISIYLRFRFALQWCTQLKFYNFTGSSLQENFKNIKTFCDLPYFWCRIDVNGYECFPVFYDAKPNELNHIDLGLP